MELVRISANNVKVTLTEEELDSYGITVPDTDGDYCCAAKHAVKKILDAVKKETGVDYCGERVFIRIYRGSGGGCELFISRLPRTAQEKSGCTAVRFSGISALVEACRVMPPSTVCDAYAEDGAAYLLISSAGEAGINAAREYGNTVEFSLAEEYIREHCRLICAGNAAKRIGAL